MENIGLYIHVPFCRTRCGYCDFFSGTDCNPLAQYPSAVCRELEERFGSEPPATVYFGGGTPSLLSAEGFRTIFQGIEACCRSSIFPAEHCEITFEANPDDLTDAYLESLIGLPFNRISIGIQSFNDGELRFIGRRHTARQAVEAVERCRRYGLQNISIDLMYGLPFQTMQSWNRSIDTAIELGVEHISAYMLGIEPDVPLYRSLQKGDWTETDDETAEAMYLLLSDKLQQAGFEHYEISNFARPGRRSRHNSSYWHGVSYLGLGPGAHSFDAATRTRRWNFPSLPGYLQAYLPATETRPNPARSDYHRRCGNEHLTSEDQYNEYIMTRLRTSDGINLSELQHLFPPGCSRHFRQVSQKYASRLIPFLTADGEAACRLLPDSWFISDGIIRDLMV